MQEPLQVPGTKSVTDVRTTSGHVVVDDTDERLRVAYMPDEPDRMVIETHGTHAEHVMLASVGSRPPRMFEEVTIADPNTGAQRTFEVQGVRQESDGSVMVRDEFGAWLRWGGGR